MLAQEALFVLLCWLLAEDDNQDIPSLSQVIMQPDITWDDLSTEDWSTLIEIAKGEGVAPLLYWRFNRLGTFPIPEEFRKVLARAYYESTAFNSMLFEELQRVLLVLKETKIPVILLKGADLAHSLYAEVGLRPMSDLDLLIPYTAFSSALRKLESDLLYKIASTETAPDLQRVVAYHVLLLGGVNQLVKLELHWNLVSSEESWYAVPVAWFWEHSRTGSVGHQANGESVRILTHEANLLYLAAHAMLQHGGKQSLLIWLYDIHALVTRYGEEIDWALVVREAKQLGWAGVLAAGLRECQVRFGTKYPECVLTSLDESADQRLSHLLELKADLPEMRLLYDWYTLISLRWPDRLRYAFTLVFPRRAYILQRYQPKPAWVWPVYYPYRWGRMVWGVLEALVKGLWRINAR